MKHRAAPTIRTSALEELARASLERRGFHVHEDDGDNSRCKRCVQIKERRDSFGLDARIRTDLDFRAAAKALAQVTALPRIER